MLTTYNAMTVSEIFHSIGLDGIDIGYLFIGMAACILLLLILLIVQLRKSSRLEKRLDKFMLGKDAKSLEKDIIALYEDNKFIKLNMDKNKKDIST
ncbi:MAG: DUF4446 family protein, partial [Lachnospiraceae bacterium]|nr:DUF4446 family protein [Lachnospiraceae bacterium]